MARRKRKGGARYKTVKLSLPKRLYSILNGIAMGDERKLNRLIKGILNEKLQEATVAELEAYITGENEEFDDVETEKLAPEIQK